MSNQYRQGRARAAGRLTSKASALAKAFSNPSRTGRITYRTSVVAAAVLGALAMAHAQDRFIPTDGTLNWQDAANWTSGVPTSTTDVVILQLLNPIVITGNASVNNMTFYGSGIANYGTLNVYGNIDANNILAGYPQSFASIGSGAVINVGSIGSDPATATNSVIFGDNTFGPAQNLLATQGGTIIINANTFSYLGNGGLQAGNGTPYWSAAVAADGTGSTINISANQLTIDAGNAYNSGVLNLTGAQVSGSLDADQSGTINSEATQSYSGSLYAGMYSSVNLYSATTNNGPSNDPNLAAIGAGSTYNNATINANGGFIDTYMDSYAGSATVSATGFNGAAEAYLVGNTFHLDSANISATGVGGTVQISSYGDFTLNGASNSYIQAQEGGTIYVNGQNVTVNSSVSGQNVFLSYLGSTISLSAIQNVSLDPLDFRQGGLAGGEYLLAESGTISLDAQNVSVGANTVVELIGTGATFNINPNTNGTESVYFDGLIDSGTTTAPNIVPGTGYANINGGNVQLGYQAAINATGDVVNVNNLDNANLNATNFGYVTASTGSQFNIGGNSFANSGYITYDGGTGYWGQSTPGVANTNPLTVSNAGTVDISGGGIVNYSGGIVNTATFTVNDTAELLGDANSKFVNNSGYLTFGGSVGVGSPAGTSTIGSLDNLGGNFVMAQDAGLNVGTFTNEEFGNAYVEGGAVLNVAGTLYANTASSLEVVGYNVSYGGGPIVNYGGGIVNAGSLSVQDGIVTIDSTGTTGAGTATMNVGSADITASNQTSQSSPGDVSQAGSVNVWNGGQFNVTTGDLTLQQFGYVSAENGGAINVATGNLQLHDQSSLWVEAGSLTVGQGNLSLHDNSTWTTANSATTITNGSVYAHDNSMVTFYQNSVTTVGRNYINRDQAVLNMSGDATLNVGGNFVNRDTASVSVNGTGDGVFTGINVKGNLANNSANGIFVGGGATLNVGGNLNNGSSGNIDVSDPGSSINVTKGSVNNNGYLSTINGATTTVTAGDYNNNNYTYIDFGSSLTVGGTYTQLGVNSQTKLYGDLYGNVVLGSATANGGTFGGRGTVHGSFNNISGTVNVGDPQVLNITGDYNQGANGTLILNVFGNGGAGAPNGNDELNVSGKFTLSGTLDVVFGNGYNPSSGVVLNLFQAGSFGGSFSSIEETFANGTVVNLGSGLLNLNGGNGSFTTQAVPEPTTIAVFGLGALGLLLRRKR